MNSRLQISVLMGGLVSLLAGLACAYVMPVEVTLLPPSDQANRLQTTVTLTVSPYVVEDSDPTDVTGNIAADLDVSFDSAHEPNAITAITFVGGRVQFSDVIYSLYFGGRLGYIEIEGTGLEGTWSTPELAGAVAEGQFEMADHRLILDAGVVTATPHGFIEFVFPGATVDLAAEPLETTTSGQGQVEIHLETLDYPQAVYAVSLTMPVDFDEVLLDDPDTGAEGRFAVLGQIVAAGTVQRQLCRLAAELAGLDCCVDAADLMAFVDQWLLQGDPADCVLSADLAAQDCYVDLADLAVLASEWLRGCLLEEASGT